MSPSFHIFCIPTKELKTYEVDFRFPNGIGFLHVEKSFYAAGGYRVGAYSNKFIKITHNGELSALAMMPTHKGYFPMILWVDTNSLLTVGGFMNGAPLK